MWRVVPGQSLQHRAWEDECVLYNSLSGDTHLLAANAIHVLLCLQQGPLDEAALAESLSESFEFDPGSDVAAEVAGLLSGLQALSLVELIEC